MELQKRETWTMTGLTIVRIAVGWHFLFEGFSKLFAQGWTAKYFLEGSNSFMAGFYHALATSPALMDVVA